MTKYHIHLLSIIIFCSCNDANISLKNNASINGYDNSHTRPFSDSINKSTIYGRYHSMEDDYYSCSLFLYEDGFYKIRSSGCTERRVDSGYFILTDSNKIVFNSIVISDSNLKDDFDPKYHLDAGNVSDHKIDLFNNKKKRGQLYKKGFTYNNFDRLNKSGNGFTIRLDTFLRRIETGEFKNYKLHNGSRTIFYGKDHYPNKHNFIKNGRIDTTEN